MSKLNRPLASGDVVRILEGQCAGITAVINRIEGDAVNIFMKNQYIGIWFNILNLKRIGKVKTS